MEQEGSSRGLRGARQSNNRAFQAALLGWRTAFPEPMASQCITSALQAAASTCSSHLAEVFEEAPEIQESFQNSILMGLWQAAGLEEPSALTPTPRS